MGMTMKKAILFTLCFYIFGIPGTVTAGGPYSGVAANIDWSNPVGSTGDECLASCESKFDTCISQGIDSIVKCELRHEGSSSNIVACRKNYKVYKSACSEGFGDCNRICFDKFYPGSIKNDLPPPPTPNPPVNPTNQSGSSGSAITSDPTSGGGQNPDISSDFASTKPGGIKYYTSAELGIRENLQQLCLPDEGAPYLDRNKKQRVEWDVISFEAFKNFCKELKKEDLKKKKQKLTNDFLASQGVVVVKTLPPGVPPFGKLVKEGPPSHLIPLENVLNLPTVQNVTTRSGGNKFSGSKNYYYQSDSWVDDQLGGAGTNLEEERGTEAARGSLEYLSDTSWGSHTLKHSTDLSENNDFRNFTDAGGKNLGEGIQEQSVLTGGASAEHGKNKGEVINVVTKGGNPAPTLEITAGVKYLNNPNWNIGTGDFNEYDNDLLVGGGSVRFKPTWKLFGLTPFFGIGGSAGSGTENKGTINTPYTIFDAGGTNLNGTPITQSTNNKKEQKYFNASVQAGVEGQFKSLPNTYWSGGLLVDYKENEHKYSANFSGGGPFFPYTLDSDLSSLFVGPYASVGRSWSFLKSMIFFLNLWGAVGYNHHEGTFNQGGTALPTASNIRSDKTEVAGRVGSNLGIGIPLFDKIILDFSVFGGANSGAVSVTPPTGGGSQIQTDSGWGTNVGGSVGVTIPFGAVEDFVNPRKYRVGPRLRF